MAVLLTTLVSKVISWTGDHVISIELHIVDVYKMGQNHRLRG